MRSLIRYFVEHKIVTYFFSLLLFIGGIASFFSLGQLEDPNFSVKDAVIITKYPGASPEEVEQEVTDRIEQAVQQMPQVKYIRSYSQAGLSQVKVTIKPQYWSKELSQIWDEMRKKVRDVTPLLPPGVQQPQFGDDFGFVFGFLLAMTADGFSYKEMEDYADEFKKYLDIVPGVSRVDLWGVQKKAIYLDINEQQLASLNLTPATIVSTLKDQNLVVDAGALDISPLRLRISPSGEFTSPEEIGDLIIRPESSDIISNAVVAASENPNETLAEVAQMANDSFIRVKDIAVVKRGYIDPPATIMHYNGKPAIGIAVAGNEDANIVDVGQALYKRLNEVIVNFPIGIKIHKVAWQSDLVSESVNSFLVNLAEAVVIVLIVLIIPSGLRMGLIIGFDLILTILGTFIVMAIMDIPLQRMSLGALVIAMGMMVDNSIVVADGIAIKIREGMNRMQAAIESALQPAFPLFAATLIATMTFYPIAGSKESTGEYCESLFIVVAVALVLSWFIAIFVTPLQCLDMLSEKKKNAQQNPDENEFNKPFFRYFRQVLIKLIAFRKATILLLIALLALSLFSFGFVKQMFFPDSTRAQLMIDYWAPEGTSIHSVQKKMEQLEKELIKGQGVESISSFIGSGPPRFYLPVEPEGQRSNYGQMIINFNDYTAIDPFIEKYEPKTLENISNAMVRFRKYSVGPGNSWPLELRILGPMDANLATIRTLGNTLLDLTGQSPYGRDFRLDIMNRTLQVVPDYEQKRGRWAGISRPDLARALRRGYDGLAIGQYREGKDLYPIIIRHNQEERENFVNKMETLQVRPETSIKSVPLLQVVNGVQPEWEDPLIFRYNRRRGVNIQAAPALNATYPSLQKDVAARIADFSLPPGYELSWHGETESSENSRKALLPGLVPTIIVIVTLLILVFNAFRPIAIIFLTIPFAIIGITWGLLLFNTPFGFMALLGGMSLAGMMNKNIVVLLDACNENLASGMDRYHAIIEASVTRLRPVLLAAGTTVLGVSPLLPDVFWQAMAVTIMGGLAFGSLLTLIAVPVLYSLFYKIEEPKGEAK